MHVLQLGKEKPEGESGGLALGELLGAAEAFAVLNVVYLDGGAENL